MLLVSAFLEVRSHCHSCCNLGSLPGEGGAVDYTCTGYSFKLFLKEESLHYTPRGDGNQEQTWNTRGRQWLLSRLEEDKAVSAALLCLPRILSREGYPDHVLV